MPDLKLAKLPDRTTVKIAITVDPDLKRALDDYAKIYRITYGVEETVGALIAEMLATFLAGDRAFVRARSELHREATGHG